MSWAPGQLRWLMAMVNPALGTVYSPKVSGNGFMFNAVTE